MSIQRLILVFVFALFASASGVVGQSIQVSGMVIDAETNDALIGANVMLASRGSSEPIVGTVTNFDGQYSLDGIEGGTYDLVVRFVGFAESRMTVDLTAGGGPFVYDFELGSENVSLNTVVVTASRQEEKVLDAPASVSVMGAREVEEQATASTAATMRNVAALDMSQTGADRYEIVLRGFNNAFSGATFSLVDYRQGAVASLGVNAWLMMPISNIDTERIEIVRGAGSALYGAGVDAGVIHIVTKGPFTNPGTTISLMGGERSLIGGTFRHAGVVSEKIGYKIAGAYSQVNEWEMDVFDPIDFVELDGNSDDILAYEGSETYYMLSEDGGAVTEISPGDAPDAPFDIARDYDASKANLNGMLEYRFSELTSLVVNAGFMTAKSPILTGIGTAQADGFGYMYGQVRLRSGNFFGQAYVNQNDAGDSFVYGTGDPLVDKSRQFNAQAQYDVSLMQDRERLIFGVDYENTTPDTEGSIYGRNEDDDTISEIGAYVQSATRISEKLDLTLAGRLDHSNIYDDLRFSPRAALVFKPTTAHSFRATYNRAFSSPGNNSLFLDIVAGRTVVSAPDFIVLARGRGARDGFNFRRDPAYQDYVSSDLIATSNLPLDFLPTNPATGFSFNWNTDVPVGADLSMWYGLVYAGIAQLTPDQVREALGIPLPDAVILSLQEQLSPANTSVQGWVEGVLAKPSIEGGVDFVTDATDIEPLQQTLSETIEIGYKGIVADRVLFAVDAYRSRKEDFGGPLLFETPIVLVPTLSADLTAALAEGISNNVALSTALAQLQIPPEALAATITSIAAGSLPAPDDAVAIVQPSENLDGPLGPEALLSYRNFGEIDFWGVDVAAQIMINEYLDGFANYSYVSDDFFDEEELDSPGNQLALNAPKHKIKGGLHYSKPLGASAMVSARWIDEFPVVSGPYVGSVPSYFLLDIGAGYDLAKWLPGLRIDLLVQNVFDELHREFVGAPQLGRFTTFRATYGF